MCDNTVLIADASSLSSTLRYVIIHTRTDAVSFRMTLEG